MAAAREYSVAYNGLTIPGTISSCKTAIHGPLKLAKSSRDFTFAFQVCLYDCPTAADMATAVSSLENSFRGPEGNLTVTLTTLGGGDVGVMLDLDFSNNEGLNMEASIEKAGGEADSGRSRLYDVEITGDLPWTVTSPAAGQQGLRDFSYTVEFSPSRRAMLTMEGEYTVQRGGSGAVAQYTANITALYNAIISALAFGTWPAVGQPEVETRAPDKNDQIMSFKREYKEIVLAERLGLTDDPQVIKQELQIERVVGPAETAELLSAAGPQSAVRVVPPDRLVATYMAAIDQTATKDLKDAWESRLRDWVISNVRNLSGGGRLVLESESFKPDLVENTISATMDFITYVPGSTLSLSVRETITIDSGHIISKVWPATPTRNLDLALPTGAYVFDGAKTITKTIITTRTFQEAFAGIDLLKGAVGVLGIGGMSLFGGAGGRSLVITSRTAEFSRRRVQAKGIGDGVDLVDEVITETVELVGKVQ